MGLELFALLELYVNTRIPITVNVSKILHTAREQIVTRLTLGVVAEHRVQQAAAIRQQYAMQIMFVYCQRPPA